MFSRRATAEGLFRLRRAFLTAFGAGGRGLAAMVISLSVCAKQQLVECFPPLHDGGRREAGHGCGRTDGRTGGPRRRCDTRAHASSPYHLRRGHGEREPNFRER